MMREISVSTAASIEGWHIEEYCGFVTSQVVAGTGFFSDFAASFSDFFGGRSGTYQRQLASLRAEALQRLREQALRVGANWIIGARMDFDEISGKNKQMFMVTVQGTAVRASRNSAGPETASGPLVPAEDLRFEVVRGSLIARIEDGDDGFDEDGWTSLAEHRVDEAVPLALREVVRVKQAGMDSSKMHDRALSFFRALDVDALQRRLHGALIESPEIARLAETFIIQMGVVDLKWVLEHLGDSDPRVRRSALQILQGYPPFFTSSEVAMVKAIADLLDKGFSECVEMVDHKGMLSKSVERRWRCICGAEHRLGDRSCFKCGGDKMGLFPGDLYPADAAKKLREWLEILGTMLR